jgi:hypothetical protein
VTNHPQNVQAIGRIRERARQSRFDRCIREGGSVWLVAYRPSTSIRGSDPRKRNRPRSRHLSNAPPHPILPPRDNATVSPDPSCCGVSVSDQTAVDGVGEVALDIAGLPCGAFALVAGAARGCHGGLGDGHDVQTKIELTVSGTGDAVADAATGGPRYHEPLAGPLFGCVLSHQRRQA